MADIIEEGLADDTPKMVLYSGIIYNIIMPAKQIGIDINVFVAALRSRRGASHRLLLEIGSGKFEVNITVPLFLEYEYASKQLLGEIALSEKGVDDILDYVASVSNHRTIYYLSTTPSNRSSGMDGV